MPNPNGFGKFDATWLCAVESAVELQQNHLARVNFVSGFGSIALN